MAQTVGKINGDNFLVYVNSLPGDPGGAGLGDYVAHSIDATISVSQETPDATTKDSNQWVEHIRGNKSWEVSGSGLVAFDVDSGTEVGAVELIDLLMGGTAVYIRFSNSNAGDVAWEGSVSVTSTSINAPQNSATGFDFSFVGNGPLTKITLT